MKNSSTEIDPKIIKKTNSKYAIHTLIESRWSPRAFSDKDVTQEQMDELFEAARWAASANNEQPWLYAYAFRGTPGFEKLWECLLPGNQPWAKKAAVLMVTMIRTTFKRNGKSNKAAMHDLGMANAQLLIQAASRNIYGHMMGGYDPNKTKEVLDYSDEVNPVCMMALGFLGDVNNLEEPFKTRELTPRTRLSIEEFTSKI